MPLNLSKLALKSRTAIFFYVLAFLPLPLIAYSFHVNGRSILAVFISFYGFLILLLKRNELPLSLNASIPQRWAGLSLILASFLVFYEAVVTYLDSNVLYGVAAFFYAIYIIGVFLVFYSIPTLKRSFSAVLLIAAGGSSFYLGEWLEFYIEPLVPYFVPIFVFVLNVLGIPATLQNPNRIVLHTSTGPVPVLFAAGCMGIYSFLVFSIILVVVMMEESASNRAKVLWSIGGVACTFAVNILRVSLIALVIYYFGYERWGEIHSWIGYTLFLIWLGVFFVVFSKRKLLMKELRMLGQKVARLRER